MSVKALHTAARRYLLERGHPRLLEDVERREPGDFRSVEELRRWLLELAGREEDDARRPMATSGIGEHIQVVQWRELAPEQLAQARTQREAFATYVRGLGEADLRAVALLPYRRVLSERQSARWRAKLAGRWDAHPRERCWYPLNADDLPADVLALQHLNFLLEVDPEAFRALFYEHGVTRVFRFVENHIFERDYEEDVEWMVPSGPERFWTSRELNWVVYVSHESSITLAGDWLLAGVKAIWPNWQQRIYEDWAYAESIDRDALANSPWFDRPRLVER